MEYKFSDVFSFDIPRTLKSRSRVDLVEERRILQAFPRVQFFLIARTFHVFIIHYTAH